MDMKLVMAKSEENGQGLKFDFTSSRVAENSFGGLLIPVLDSPFFRSQVTKTVPKKNWE